MSLHQQARKLIDQAGSAIQAGNPQYAMELLRQSILYNGKDAEAYVLLGIALAQTNMPADADSTFKRAVKLAPDNVKARYNLAVHQYAQGEVRHALESARIASQIDVRHQGSRDLAARIEAELGIEPGGQPKTTAAGSPAAYREGYEDLHEGSMPLVERMGPAWPAIGWGIACISLAFLVTAIIVLRPYASMQNTNGESLVKMAGEDPNVNLVRIFFFLSVFGGIVFTAVDAINRRGNLLWLLPQAICGCLGFTWLVLPIYMLTGRNKPGTSQESPTV